MTLVKFFRFRVCFLVGAPIIYHTWPKVAAVIRCLNKSTVQPVTQYFVNTSYNRKVAKQSDVGQEITFSHL